MDADRQEPHDPDTCLGPPTEDLVYEHSTVPALCTHLTVFLGHRSPQVLISKCGLEAVNQAIKELPTDNSINSPAGWISWRAARIHDGSPPTPSAAAIRRSLRLAAARAKVIQDYNDRHGL